MSGGSGKKQVRQQKRELKKKSGSRVGWQKAGQSLKLPWYVTLQEDDNNKVASMDISLAQVLNNDAFFAGIPWRITRISIVATAISAQPASLQSSRVLPGPAAAILQISFNSAMNDNVEGISSTRILCTSNPVRRVLRARGPNLYKEDEQRNQSLMTIEALPVADNIPYSVVLYIVFHLQLGPIQWRTPKQLTHLTNVRRRDDDDDSSSLASHLSRLSIV